MRHQAVPVRKAAAYRRPSRSCPLAAESGWEPDELVRETLDQVRPIRDEIMDRVITPVREAIRVCPAGMSRGREDRLGLPADTGASSGS
jgi:hypothetical protein